MLAVNFGCSANARGNPMEDERGSELPCSDSAFDQWLTHHLGKLYDPVVNEPLPHELIRLILQRKPQ